MVVPASQPLVPITYTAYGDESDPGPFPIPLNAPIEGGGGGDAHVLVVQQDTCQLFELFASEPTPPAGRRHSGARFDLNTGALRPLGWTSADAAGLPILPGLVRYEEVAAGAIDHAIRVTFSRDASGLHPARHALRLGRLGPDVAGHGHAVATERQLRRRHAHRPGKGHRRPQCSGTG